MFFATTTPTNLRRQAYSPAGLSLERFLQTTQMTSRQAACAVSQDEKSYTLSFDIPGIAKEHLNIGIEGNIVRIESREGAARQYKQACELPQDIDVASSEAKLENGVLTLTLGKLVPASRVTELAIR
jgi:HSP20 family protein